MPKVYKMKEVAVFLGVSYYTLFRLVKSGKIKAINVAKTGKRPIYAFTANDVQLYCNQLSSSFGGTKILD